MTFLRTIAAAIALVLLLPGGLALASGGESGGAAPARKGAVSETFLTFDPFQVSIIEHFRMRGLLIIEIYLQIPNKELHHKAEENSVRLRDSYVRALSDYCTVVAQANRPPNIGQIADKLQAATDERLGASGAKVLITQAFVQRSN